MSKRNKRSIRFPGWVLLCGLLCYLYLFDLTVMAEEPAMAETYGVQLYTVENGIPTGETNAVLQTSDGYLWFGGYGGLQRFDGVEFRQFSGNDTGLTSFSIRSLWESPSGVLWVGSNEQGAFYWNGEQFVSITSREETAYQSIRCFAQGNGEEIWIGTSDGLAYIRNKNIIPFDMTEYGRENSIVYSLYADDAGLLWGVDDAGALFCVDSQKFALVHYYLPGELWPEDVYAYSAAVLRDGSVAVGMNNNQMYIIDDATSPTTDVTMIETGMLEAINGICQTQDGYVWCCGDTGVGFLDEDGVFTDLSALENTDHLVCIQEDYEYGIWIASSRHGVLHLTPNKVSTLPLMTVEDTMTYAIARAQGNTYVATDEGLLIFDADWQPVSNAATMKLGDSPMRHVTVDGEGRVWCSGYYEGLYVYDPKEDTLSEIDVLGERVRMVLPLSDKTVAVAHYAGIHILREDMIENTYACESPILCMEELQDGSLLCGSDGSGIFVLKNGKFELYADQNDGLTGGVILRIVADDAMDEVWVSCGNDLFHGNDRKGFTLSNEITEGGGSILDIFPDNDDFWLFRSSGILLVHRASLTAPGQEVEYHSIYENTEGIPGNIVANSWSLYEEDAFWICTTNGVGYLDTQDTYVNAVHPKVDIVSVLADDEQISHEYGLYLSRDVQKLEISVAVLSFGQADSHIEYCLEGFDKTFTRGTARQLHDITYTNIPAGEYVFRVRAYNSDGVASQELTMHIEKEPRFIETPLFPFSVAMGAMMVTTAVFVRIGNNQLKRSRERQLMYKNIMDQSILTITHIIDAKDPYTKGHSLRVAEFSVTLGERLGMTAEECERLYYIALLHDIGKIGIPDHILKKEGKLTDEEYEIIRQHPVIGGTILSDFSNFLEGVSDGATYHHENYDGTGYCNQLKGEEIPLVARIISVADAYDVMNSRRCYRPPLSQEVIIGELEKSRGTQFDPAVTDAAIALIRETVVLS